MSSWSEKFIDAFNTHEVAPTVETLRARHQVGRRLLIIGRRNGYPSPRARETATDARSR